MYAGEDIVNAAGKVVVKKDELVAVEKTDQKGKLKYSNTIPHGKYYLKELEGLPDIYHMKRRLKLMLLIRIQNWK
ncbi:MAG: hypothetical protein ACLU7M_04005 [Mediterraneibacter gnavus]